MTFIFVEILRGEAQTAPRGSAPAPLKKKDLSHG